MPDADHARLLEIYEAVAARFDGARVKGKKNRYTSRNGHMTSFLAPEGLLCLRLSKEDRAAFLAAHPGPPVVQYGAVMKEYVGVPQPLVADAEALEGWFGRSWDYVGGLKPKPTRRKPG